MPSIISTASSLTENPDRKNTSRTSFNKFSASTGSSRRRPAVAFNTSGVRAQNSFGMNSFAFCSNDSIFLAPCDGQELEKCSFCMGKYRFEMQYSSFVHYLGGFVMIKRQSRLNLME